MTNTTSTRSKQNLLKKQKNLSRLEKAIQRISFSVLKRHEKIPNDLDHPGLRELELSINRILDHAEKLGWIKSPNRVLGWQRTEAVDRKTRISPIVNFEIVIPKLNRKEYFE